VKSVRSPDGAFLLEDRPYDPGPTEVRWTQELILTSRDKGELLRLPGITWEGDVTFHKSDSLEMTLVDHGQRTRIRIDLRDQTYILHPHDYPAPLDSLSTHLFNQFVNQQTYSHPDAPVSRGRLFGRLLLFLASCGFVVMGILAFMKATTTADRWKIFGVTTFFLLCTWISFDDLRRTRLKK